MTRRQPSRVPWARTTLAGVVFGGLFALCYLGFVQTRLGQRLDDFSLSVGGQYAGGPLGAAAGFWRSELPVVLAGFAVVVGVVALWRRRWRRCVAAGLLVVTSLGVGQVVKTKLSRPDLGGFGYPYNTLPSGHTIVASSVVLGLLLMAPTAWRRVPVVFLGLGLMVLTGYASVLTQAHLTSDVCCGLLVVGAAAVLVRPLADRSVVPPSGRWVWPVVPLAGFASLGCWAAVLTGGGGGGGTLTLAALAELLGITAVAALVVAVLAHLGPVGPGPDTGYGARDATARRQAAPTTSTVVSMRKRSAASSRARPASSAASTGWSSTQRRAAASPATSPGPTT